MSASRTDGKNLGAASRCFISRMLSERDGTPSIKRVVYLLAVVNAIAFSIGLLFKHDGSALIADLVKTTLITTASAYGVARFAEKPPASGS